jgi:hypothetical protein
MRLRDLAFRVICAGPAPTNGVVSRPTPGRYWDKAERKAAGTEEATMTPLAQARTTVSSTPAAFGTAQ